MAEAVYVGFVRTARWWLWISGERRQLEVFFHPTSRELAYVDDSGVVHVLR